MQTPVWIEILGSVCSGLCVLTLGAPFLILAYLSLRRVERVYQRRIRQWASENGLEITGQERRYLKHPWLVLPTVNQRVYYVTIQYQDGRPFFRHAWVRCGGWYWRPENAKIDFAWDERVPQPLPPRLPEHIAPRDDPLWDPWIDS
jgi:hypothetical protein